MLLNPRVTKERKPSFAALVIAQTAKYNKWSAILGLTQQYRMKKKRRGFSPPLFLNPLQISSLEEVEEPTEGAQAVTLTTHKCFQFCCLSFEHCYLIEQNGFDILILNGIGRLL